MTRIIGIDPGSQRTGYGVIELNDNDLVYLASGVVKLPKKSLAIRLQIIFEGVKRIIDQYQPTELGIEEVFMSKNPGSALKLGQARGAAIVAAADAGLDISEYSARSVKKSVVGVGAASKNQVQKMVVQLLKLKDIPSEDAADGLAVAICHGYSRRGIKLLAKSESGRFSRGRYL